MNTTTDFFEVEEYDRHGNVTGYRRVAMPEVAVLLRRRAERCRALVAGRDRADEMARRAAQAAECELHEARRNALRRPNPAWVAAKAAAADAAAEAARRASRKAARAEVRWASEMTRAEAQFAAVMTAARRAAEAGR